MNLYGWLKSDKVLVRVVVLWLICALLFALAWTASYSLLPEGVLRGKLLASRLPVETSQVTTTFSRILSINLFVSCSLVVVGNLFRVGETPLGYLIVMGHSVMYGILLGTNSFAIPAPGRFAPSLSTVLGHSGAFEITAYIAIAAATQGLVIWRQRSWLDWHSERVGSWRRWRLNRLELIVVIGALLLLTGANYREASQIQQLLRSPGTQRGATHSDDGQIVGTGHDHSRDSSRIGIPYPGPRLGLSGRCAMPPLHLGTQVRHS